MHDVEPHPTADSPGDAPDRSPDSAEEPAEPPPVRPDSVIGDVLWERPDARRVLFEQFRLPCYRCECRYSETLAQGTSYCGVDLDAVVARLNQCPPRDTPAS